MARDGDAADEDFARLLVAYDEALAHGETAPPAGEVSSRPEDSARLRRALDSLRLLELDRRSSPQPDTEVTAPAVRFDPATRTGQVGRFRLLRELGRGGMGVVYLAHDPVLGRNVALKVPRAEALIDPVSRRRFLHEAGVGASLDHPHIVPVYEAGEAGGICYIASAYCPGGSLAEQLRGGESVPPPEAAALVADLARAVAYLHAKGILHRDLTPGNVLRAEGGVARVTDFGLAKWLGGEGQGTNPGAPIGTASYMAPEVARGGGEPTPAVDVYGLGAILYELLTGRPPFKADTRAGVLSLVCSRAPVRPRAIRRDVPPDLEAVCLRCLDKDPARRFPSAAALADDLGRWLRGEPTLTRPPGPLARTWRAARRHPAYALLIFAAAGLLAGLPAARFATDPDRAERRIEAALARGERQVLIADTGRPAWSRVRAGDGASQVSLDGDGTYKVTTWDLCLVELVRDPRCRRYRIRAEVRHREGKSPGEVGLYFLLREQPTAAGPLYSFGQLTFNDIEGPSSLLRHPLPDLPRPDTLPAQNRVVLSPRLYAPRGGGPGWDQRLPGRNPRLFPPAGYEGGDWRPLSAEITPERVKAEWGASTAVGSIPREEWDGTVGPAVSRVPFERLPAGDRNPAGDDAPGALGLYVEKGCASFRRVVVEPLAEEDRRSRSTDDASRGDD